MVPEIKYAIVTGSSRGIGLATVKTLIDAGMHVTGWSRSQAPFRHDRFTQVPADLSDPVSIEDAYHKTLDESGGQIDVLVNNAGIGYYGEFEETPVETWQNMFRINVDGIFHCTRMVIPLMKEQGSGHIVNISSIAGLNGVKNMAGYSATKHAVRGISHSLFMELREYGIKVTCIYPGSVQTNIGDNLSGFSLAANPMMPEDIAATVLNVIDTSPNYLTVDVEVRPLKPKG